MRKFISLFLLLIVFVTALPGFPEVFDGRIYPANNGDYKDMVLPRMKEAKKSVHLIMFHASYYTDPRYIGTSPTNLLIRELVEAGKKGLKVEVILNQSDSDYDSRASGENLKTGAYLANNGVTVYMDSPNKTTHTKLLIIDGRFVVIGSTNWSYSAMAKNNETAVIIDSPQLAEFYMKYFENLKKECRPFLAPPPSP